MVCIRLSCSMTIANECFRFLSSSWSSELPNGQHTANVPDHSSEDGISLQREGPNGDSEVLRKAKEEGVVDVVFPGYVTKDTCCRFVCEILKCVLYQRQQLPMTYDQLKYHQKQQQLSTQVREMLGDGRCRTPSLPSYMCI